MCRVPISSRVLSDILSRLVETIAGTFSFIIFVFSAFFSHSFLCFFHIFFSSIFFLCFFLVLFSQIFFLILYIISFSRRFILVCTFSFFFQSYLLSARRNHGHLPSFFSSSFFHSSLSLTQTNRRARRGYAGLRDRADPDPGGRRGHPRLKLQADGPHEGRKFFHFPPISITHLILTYISLN